MLYDYLLKGNDKDSPGRYNNVNYEEVVKKPKFDCILFKYVDLKRDITEEKIANTISSKVNMEKVKESKNRKEMREWLIEKHNFEGIEADMFLNYMGNMNEEQRKQAEKLRIYYSKRRQFEEDRKIEGSNCITRNVIYNLRLKHKDWFPKNGWANPLKGISNVPDIYIAHNLAKGKEAGVKRNVLRDLLEDNMFNKKEIDIIDTYYDLMGEQEIKAMKKYDKKNEKNEIVLKEIDDYIKERNTMIQERDKKLAEKLVEYADKIKINGKEVKFDYILDKDSYAHPGFKFIYNYNFRILSKEEDNKLLNMNRIGYTDLLILIKREASKTGIDYKEINDFINNNFGSYRRKDKVKCDKDGTEFLKEYPYWDTTENCFYENGIKEWYENFGEDKRENIRVENKVDSNNWDNIFKESDGKNHTKLISMVIGIEKLKQNQEEKLRKQKYNNYHKRRRNVNKKEKVNSMEK